MVSMAYFIFNAWFGLYAHDVIGHPAPGVCPKLLDGHCDFSYLAMVGMMMAALWMLMDIRLLGREVKS
ncbi:MAG: hypothetical protein COV10_03090 [Candidatus Vogelbacteria bacterium CG10_big_fil_rev_8_21_14_0_10_51_16]|uniref:Uncharacterized protein n=1 Tax=Candidatus Vogelbacteria bacterium CG10_big_fil_rev_8_21_14_0_10_51_16 TaxID=1975045 RepID=A0A2H0RFP6_9BACT|nr:MAG: hypothetical protein COV10_03090 [Candidatus Vogelbacteria bacterium CG10_big_fil_rev_8_21_14_0_10_51_16]